MTFGRFVLLATLLLMAVSVAAQTAYAPAGAEWPTYNGTVDSRRYSSLDQINTTNVGKLRPVWMFQTGIANVNSSFECTPLVIGNRMYVTSPDDTVSALDATTGEIQWIYTPKLLFPANFQQFCCGRVNRGVAYYHAPKPENDLIYIATLDARLIALNASDGSPAKSFGKEGIVTIADYKSNYSETSAPVVWNGRIFLGVAGSEFKTRGFISSYDAESGKLIWRFYAVPAPNETGGKTWPPGRYKTGGVGVWMTPTIDEKYRQVIFATGNPNPDFDGRTRIGDNLFSCGIVAVDADTGKLKWYFQEVRHDLWDYDQSGAPILFITNITGQPIDAAGAAAKTGWFYMIDRSTGKSIVPMKEVKVPKEGVPDASPVQYVPDDGPPYFIKPFVAHSDMWTPPRFFSKHNVAPGLSGGSEWSPLSYSPKTNFIYIAAIEKEMYFCRQLFPQSKKSAAKAMVSEPDPVTQLACIFLLGVVRDLGLSLNGVAIVPFGSSVHGSFLAIDADTGNIAPKFVADTVTPHPIGGTVVTAGDLLFAGESNGYFDAIDARTGGKPIWRFFCGAGVNAAPMTYAVKDASGKMRQYVAVSAGGLAGASLPNAAIGEKDSYKYFRSGNTVIVFALPDD